MLAFDPLGCTDLNMSSQGWSCGTLGEGYQAVVHEDEATLQALEDELLQEIKDRALEDVYHIC